MLFISVQVCGNTLRCQVDSCFISVFLVCLEHSGKDFINIRHQQQGNQSELSRKEQRPRVIFPALLPVSKQGQDRENTKGWQVELSWPQRQTSFLARMKTLVWNFVSCSEDKYILHSIQVQVVINQLPEDGGLCSWFFQGLDGGGSWWPALLCILNSHSVV